MLKNLLAVLLGYLVMFVLIFALFSAIMLGLGIEGTYKPASWEPTTLWIALSFVADLIAAFVGGWVCLRVARDRRAALWLMGLMLIMGVVSIAMQASAPRTLEQRPPKVSPMEAAGKSAPPLWAAFGHVAFGLAGVWLARGTYKQ